MICNDQLLAVMSCICTFCMGGKDAGVTSLKFYINPQSLIGKITYEGGFGIELSQRFSFGTNFLLPPKTKNHYVVD